MPQVDIVAFIRLLTVAAIPVLFGITLHDGARLDVGRSRPHRRFAVFEPESA